MGSITLPSHLPKLPRPACPGPDDEFLRKHFRWSLKANLLGWDIKKDYTSNDIFRAMEELGVDTDEVPLAPVNDERWNTVIGKEIWDELMRNKLYWAEHASMLQEEGQGSQEDEP